MGKQPVVSVIVPIYNVQQYLDCCISSLRNQTLKDIEIILVDDESPDSCPQLCDEYALQDDRIKVIHKKNGGLGFARNSGMEAATGKYVTFVDGDDYVQTDTYELAAKLAEENNLDILRFGLDRFVKEGSFTEQNKEMSLQIISEAQDMRLLALQIFSRPLLSYQRELFSGGSVCTALFRLDFIRKHSLKFHSEREFVSEDFVFTYDCYQKAARVGNVPYTFYHYRVNPFSLTKVIDLGKMQRIYDFSHYFTERYKQDGYSEDEADIYPMSYYLSAMRAQTKLVLLSKHKHEKKQAWFNGLVVHPYVDKIAAKYPLKQMTFFQRIHFWTFRHNLYYMLKGIVSIYEWMKRIKH